MKSKLAEKVESLKAAVSTITYQLENLQKYYSKEQVRCWRIRRRNLNAQLKDFEKLLKAQKTKSLPPVSMSTYHEDYMKK